MNRVIPWIALALAVAAPLPAADKIPEGFVEQVLEPTGGKLLRPKDWFYKEGHREGSLMWTISKEDTKDGKVAYDTGVRIQLFLSPQEKTGKSAETHGRGIFKKQKEEAEKVVRVIEEVKQDSFTRIGLEVEERNFRILYSIFWSNDMDLLVVSISGAPAKEWDKHTSTFDTMAAMTLIDMKRFDEDGKDVKDENKPKKAEK